MPQSLSSSQEMASLLLEIEAFQFSPKKPFTYASGLKGPLYCDNRLLMGFPQARAKVMELLKNLVEEKCSEVELIAGMATAGIPFTAWLSDLMNLPMVYVRKEAKGHGQGRSVEGPFKHGQKTIVIEDLVNQGSSLKKGIHQLKQQKLHLLGSFSLVSYGFAGEELEGIPLFSLTRLNDLIKVAKEQGRIDSTDEELIWSWFNDPESWYQI